MVCVPKNKAPGPSWSGPGSRYVRVRVRARVSAMVGLELRLE